jgi:hypothetical protein
MSAVGVQMQLRAGVDQTFPHHDAILGEDQEIVAPVGDQRGDLDLVKLFVGAFITMPAREPALNRVDLVLHALAFE